jgi:hypothetical protein
LEFEITGIKDYLKRWRSSNLFAEYKRPQGDGSSRESNAHFVQRTRARKLSKKIKIVLQGLGGPVPGYSSLAPSYSTRRSMGRSVRTEDRVSPSKRTFVGAVCMSALYLPAGRAIIRIGY